MHKEELKDEVKDLFGNFTESKYLRYFTSRFPRLLIHCYNAVEKEARKLLAEYFHEDVPAIDTRDTRDLELEGSNLTINCNEDITFPEKKVEIDTLMIENNSHLYVEQNISFTNFLQRNASNITQLKFLSGSLKFDSMNKILQKLPNLKEIELFDVKFEASKTNQTFQQTTCKNLAELKILWIENSNLLQAFSECQTLRKLEVSFSEVTLEEILQKYASLEELKVLVRVNYQVSDQDEANATIHQLKVLTIELHTEDEKIHQHVISSILKQNDLQQFYFDSNFMYSLSQSLSKQLAAHICHLECLTSLQIYDKRLLEEVEAFAANCLVANTRLKKFKCQLKYFKSLPTSFLAHFTNLRKLDIKCKDAEEKKMEDLISFMHKSQLTTIKLWDLHSTCFQQFQRLQVVSLQILKIHINNINQVELPVLDILQEFLPRHPNITQFEIRFYKDYDEEKSLELIPMILATSPQLERLVVDGYSKITPDVIKHIAALKTLKKSWRINNHKSKTFYKTQN